MSPALRVLLRTLPACGVAAAVIAFVVPLPAATPKSESLCSTLKVWADENFRDASPSLDEVAKYDRAHRLALFSTVSPAVRAGLWKEQLRRAANRADLTAQQRALLIEAQTLVTPAAYMTPLKDREEMSAPLRDFSTRTTAIFTSPEHRRLLVDLGAAAGAAATRPPSVWARIARPFGRSDQAEWCECNGATYFFDCMGQLCLSGGGCVDFDGCGIMGNFRCVGMCDW